MPESSAEANHVVKPTDTPSAPPSSVLEHPAMSKLTQSMVNDLSDAIDAVTQKDKHLGLKLDAIVREALERGEAPLAAGNGEKQPNVLEGDCLTTAPKISCANPKGKFDVVFTTTHLALRNAKTILQVRYTDIKAVYILDKLPAERAGKVYLVLQFNSSCTVTHGKRALDNFTLELSDQQKLDIVVDPKASPNQKADRKKGAAAVVLCAVLGQMKVTTFLAPDKGVFSGRGGSACIGALLKFNQGYLFPLKDALLFIGSQCFVLPHASVLAVDMPGAETERREFDIVLHGHNGEKLYELNQVDNRDLAAWGYYMQRRGLNRVASTWSVAELDGQLSVAYAPGAGAGADNPAENDTDGVAATAELHAAVTGAEAEDEDEEDEDEDFDADAEEEESDEDEGSQDHYAGGAALPSKKRGAPSDAGAGSSKGNSGAAASMPPVAAGGHQHKRLRSSGPTEALALPDDIYATEMGALEELDGDEDSEGDDSDADEDAD